MKVLLIYPRYPDTFWSFKHAVKFISRRAALPPLGLVTIASYLPKEWDIRLIDMNCEKLRDKDILNADYIMISAMSIQRESSLEIINRCNKLNKPIIAGGPLFTMEPEAFGKATLVLGEAEEQMEGLIKDMKKGKLKKIYLQKRFPDIKKTKIPRWDLLNLKWYASMSIQYSRGCPFNCEFCSIGALNGRIPRSKSAEQINRELQALYDAGWRKSVFFVDDNFIGNKAKLKKDILPSITKWQRKHNNPFEFYTEVSINFSDDDELMKQMFNAGFDKVFIGIETPDEDSLKEANKYQNVTHDLVKSVDKIQKFGFEVQGGFIVGFDNETPTIFKRQFSFIQKTNIITAMVGLLNAPRGSRLYDRLKKEGRLLGEMVGNNVDIMTNIIPKMDKNILVSNYKKLMANLYKPKNYYKRVKGFLSLYKIPKFRNSKIYLNEIGAFIKSIFIIGIFGKERMEYWKLLTWSIFKKPKAFAKAVTFSIYGYHFRKIVEHIMAEESAKNINAA